MSNSATRHGDYGGFGAILDEARSIEAELRQRDRPGCPVCDSRLNVRESGEVDCPLGHFTASRYPKELE